MIQILSISLRENIQARGTAEGIINFGERTQRHLPRLIQGKRNKIAEKHRRFICNK